MEGNILWLRSIGNHWPMMDFAAAKTVFVRDLFIIIYFSAKISIVKPWSHNMGQPVVSLSREKSQKTNRLEAAGLTGIIAVVVT